MPAQLKNGGFRDEALVVCDYLDKKISSYNSSSSESAVIGGDFLSIKSVMCSLEDKSLKTLAMSK